MIKKIIHIAFYGWVGIMGYQCTVQNKTTKKEYSISASESSVDYAHTITAQELKEHLYVIASDKYKGRETGKIGQQLTEKYMIEEFKKDGVAPGNNGSYVQEFNLIESLPPQANFTYNGNEYFYLKHFYFFPTLANYQNFEVPLADIYDVQYGISSSVRDDYGKLEVKDKVVIARVDNPEDVDNVEWSWREKIKVAKEKQVKAILFVTKDMEASLERYSHFLEQATMRLKDESVKTRSSDNIPFFFISQDMYTNLLMEGNEGESENEGAILSFNIKEVTKDLTSSNVLGFIEGSDEKLKNEIVILTAHYDHIGVKGQEVYNGADDDGSGTVALLEIAEAFQKAKNDGKGPKRSVLIMPVSGEEKGLLGSSYYVSNPVYPLANTIVDLNIDMIGRIDEKYGENPNYVYLIGSDRISTELHYLSEQVNKTYSNLELDYTYNQKNDPNRYYYRSDHYNFAKNGIPVIFYFNGTHDDYHKPSDTVEKIDFNKIEKISRLIFHTAWEIANKKDRLSIDN